MNDSELQNMMLEIQEHRKRERDFTSLEDQIRCLKKRFYNLDATEQDDEDKLKQAVIAQGIQVDSLREQMQELRTQIQSSKRNNGNLNEKNTRLYHLEGEKNAELASLRGDTTKQLTNNQDLEGEIERMKHINQRLQEESDEIQLQKSRVER